MNNFLPPTGDQFPAQAHRLNRLFWLAALALNLLILALVFVLTLRPGQPGPETLRLVKTDQVVMAVVLGLLLLVMFLRKNFLQPDRLIAINSRRRGGDKQALQSRAEETTLAGLFRLQLKYQILIWVVIDLVALTALIEFLILNRFQTFLTYYIVSLMALLVHIPRYSFLEILLIRSQNR